MSENRTDNINALVQSDITAITERSSNLVRRGLSTLENIEPTSAAMLEAKQRKREYRGLSDETIKIAITKPPSWEYLLYLHVFVDEIDSYESIRQAIDTCYSPNPPEILNFSDAHHWIANKADKVVQILENVSQLFDEHHDIAFGLPGEEGNIDATILLARRICLVYKELLEIRLQCVTVENDPLYDKLLSALEEAVHGTTTQFEAYGQDSLILLTKRLSTVSVDEQEPISLTLKLGFDMDKILKESKRVRRSLEQRLTNTR